MIYELRTYTCMPGQLAAVLKRFETTIMAAFERHGIRSGPILTVAVGQSNQEIKYWVEWDSNAERETKWAALRQDPEFQRVMRESDKDGPLVANISSELLQPAGFSIKEAPGK